MSFCCCADRGIDKWVSGTSYEGSSHEVGQQVGMGSFRIAKCLGVDLAPSNFLANMSRSAVIGVMLFQRPYMYSSVGIAT